MFLGTLTAFAALSGILMLWQWIAGIRFPLEKRGPVAASLPSVSLLKPVKGADEGSREALETWLVQSYPGPCQILFGVESEEDPAVPVIRSLLAQHPKADARLVLCHEAAATNRKVSALIQMSRLATGSHVVISDADVIAAPDLVAQLIQPLQDPAIGLVHCLYRVTGASTPATRWEAFVVNVDFWSQVLQNRTLGPLRYALGASMAVRRADLDAVGGFGALAHYLADDNRLGYLVTGLGKRTHLCPVVVNCHCPAAGWKAIWRHQLRWAITIRVCQPLPYFLSILANGTLWPLLWMTWAHTPTAWTLGAALLGLRWAQAASLQARFTGRPVSADVLWLTPVKDLLHALLWAASLGQREVLWRGHRYRVRPNGLLEVPE